MKVTFETLMYGRKFYHDKVLYIKLRTVKNNAHDMEGVCCHIDSGTMVHPVSNAREIHADWLRNL